jgi:hypothetical protein
MIDQWIIGSRKVPGAEIVEKADNEGSDRIIIEDG